MTAHILHPQLVQGASLNPHQVGDLIESYTPVDLVSAHYKNQFFALLNSSDHFANRFNYYAEAPGHMTASAYVYHPGLNAIALTDDDTFHLNEAEALEIQWVKIADLRTKMPMWLSNSRVVRHLEARFGG